MAEIIENDSGSKKEGGKRRSPRKFSAGVDMTPMVDLMCLLITFFMLTTAFSKPKVMEITMPDKSEVPDPDKDVKVDAKRTFSILLGENDKIYWYWHKDAVTDGVAPTFDKWHATTYGPEGIRKFLLEKNDATIKEISALKEKVKTGALVMPNDTLNVRIKEIKRKYNTELKKSPIILIKAVEKAKYRNLVDIIDEMAICNIASYAVVDPMPDELEILKTAPK
jgi:biopolymer transport protein ExbD